MTRFNKEGVYFLPLGGADEIGMNMYAYGCDGKWIVVDAGYGFLNEDYPGMEMCFACPDFLEEFKDDIEGLFITHGHEDHMGAIAHVWSSLQCPVYGTDFALGLIRERLKEYKMDNTVPLISVRSNPQVKTQNFEIDFISLVHSIPETCGLLIKTRYGNIFHATDWRFDDGKLDMLPTAFDKLQKMGANGVSMFVCDSTNIMVEKKQPSENEIRQSLLEIIPEIKGGLIVTCFASNLMRLESLILAAEKANRTPVLIGKSLHNNMKIAKECGYFKDLPTVYKPEQVQGISSDNAMYICTGSQANYRSALSVIANGDSKYVKLSANDTIIFSSKIIPGNEDKIEKMQEKMIDLGVTVITEETTKVHTSGHASREELKTMYEIVKPEIVFPVHGDKRFIREHKRFALNCGVPAVCSGQNGDVFRLKDGKIEKVEEICAGIMGVDRGRPISLDSKLITNRRRIAYNCSLFISMVVSKEKHLKDLQLTSADILPEEEWEALAAAIKTEVLPLAENKIQACGGLNSDAKDYIRGQIRRRIEKVTQIKPVTIMHVYIDSEEKKNECSSS